VVADDTSYPIRNVRVSVTGDLSATPVLTDEDARFTLAPAPADRRRNRDQAPTGRRDLGTPRGRPRRAAGLSHRQGRETCKGGRPRTLLARHQLPFESRRAAACLARAQADGSFEFANLAPGSYFLAAIDPAEAFWADRPWDDVEFLEALVAGATRVTLSESQNAAIALRLIATP
jgi:hypothetical protein